MSTPVLAYWDIRGLANPIRLLLEHVGQPYEFKKCDESWFQQKYNLGIEFPNLPYYIDGDHKIAQSGAILGYIARKHKLVAKNEDDVIRQDVFDGVVGDFRQGWVHLVYQSENIEQDKVKFLERMEPVLKELDAKLGKQQYVIGDYLTYNDFVLFEIVDVGSKLMPEMLTQHKNIAQFHGRIGNLKGVKEYLQSDRNPKKFNGPSAKWGG